MPLDWKTNYWEKPGFTVGDKVEILPPDERTEEISWGARWAEPMDKTIGKIGKISEINLIGTENYTKVKSLIPISEIRKVRVVFKGLECGRYDKNFWAYPPWLLRKV
jgi:hypothetical protein